VILIYYMCPIHALVLFPSGYITCIYNVQLTHPQTPTQEVAVDEPKPEEVSQMPTYVERVGKDNTNFTSLYNNSNLKGVVDDSCCTTA
jgi:hypothetical protein